MTCTRRDSLRRHQNSHTGTVEEAAAATATAKAGALATRSGSNRGGRQRSDREPSPCQESLSTSPNSELAPMNGIPRHPGEYQDMNSSPLPCYLRGEYHVPPTVPTTASFSNGRRPTSHPTPRQSWSASGISQMIGVGWRSPSQNMPSPWQSHGHVYPYPAIYGSGAAMNQHMFYQTIGKQGRD
jgi:hypothetical protein